MGAKEYLLQIRLLDTKINQRLKELEGYKRRMYGAKGVSYDGVRVQTSPTPDNIGEAVGRAIEMEKEINRMVEGLWGLKHRIIGEIHSLDNDLYIKILYMRYVELKSLEEIAVETAYSYRQVLRLHGLALLDFQKNRNMAHNVTF